MLSDEVLCSRMKSALLKVKTLSSLRAGWRQMLVRPKLLGVLLRFAKVSLQREGLVLILVKVSTAT